MFHHCDQLPGRKGLSRGKAELFQPQFQRVQRAVAWSLLSWVSGLWEHMSEETCWLRANREAEVGPEVARDNPSPGTYQMTFILQLGWPCRLSTLSQIVGDQARDQNISLGTFDIQIKTKGKSDGKGLDCLQKRI